MVVPLEHLLQSASASQQMSAQKPGNEPGTSWTQGDLSTGTARQHGVCNPLIRAEHLRGANEFKFCPVALNKLFK